MEEAARPGQSRAAGRPVRTTAGGGRSAARSPHRGGARQVHGRGADARERSERRGAPARLRRDSAQRGRPDERIPAPRARPRRPGPPARQGRAEARRAPTRVPIFNAVAPSRSRLPSNELTHAVRQGSGTPVAPGRPSPTTLRDRRERDLRRVTSGAGGVTARPSRATAPCSPARGLPATAVLRQRYTSGRRSSRVPRGGQRLRFGTRDRPRAPRSADARFTSVSSSTC